MPPDKGQRLPAMEEEQLWGLELTGSYCLEDFFSSSCQEKAKDVG